MSTKTRFIFICTLVWFIAVLPITSASPASESLNPSDYIKQITPLKEQQRVIPEIIRELKKNHYKKVAIDDTLSSKVFDRYLSDIDPSHMYFLMADIKELDPLRYRIDDGLLKSDITPAYTIFNRYEERLAQRLVFMVSRTDTGLKDLNLEKNESLETNRENAPWPSTRSELEGLWLKTLKNDVINMRLEGKNSSEIATTLSKRYWSQLKRLNQTTSEDVFQMFMNSLASTYDPHTAYFSPRSSENFNINMSLSLEGIGAMLTTDNEHTKVVRLVPAGPADKSKQLKPNDRIIGVGQGQDGEIMDVIGWRLDDVVDLIRGPKNTIVRLKIIPADASNDHQTRIVKLIRSTVQLEDQAASKDVLDISRGGHNYKIGIIHVPTFYLDIRAMQSDSDEYKSTTRDVKRLLNELDDLHVNGVIVDLRDNGGGSLHEANTLTGLFIKRGPTVQIRSADGVNEILYDRDNKIFYSGPMAVVVGRLSASASEIFAGAIQDYGRGIIIGENTFGKGSVQTLLSLSHGQLKVTTSKFYRISGESTQHRGVIPDIFYPSLYDKDTIGESSLHDAMPWDAIAGVPHYLFGDISPYKAQLRSMHTARCQHDPDYQYLLGMINYLKEARDKKKVSLKLATRLQEKKRTESERLDLENKLRKAKGQKTITRLDQLNEDKDKEDAPRVKPARDDAELIESGNI
ncbi:MAG TPA: carboxy terminal-processing peptidase, partial [Desulfomonilia bacterium]|nr:carboxy terminal-processing peptidase [Desulfomonilia bacterium]